MNRRQFVTAVGIASAAATAVSVLEPEWANAEPARDPEAMPPSRVDTRFLDTLTKVNDLQVTATVASFQQQIDSGASPRTLAQSALRLVTGYANPRGQRFHDASLLTPVATLLTALAARQNPSGLYDIGNLDSPPDTSFVISDLGLATDILLLDDQEATSGIRAQYAAIMRRSARALIEGGVHTPNHRWEICKALAHLDHLWPSRALQARINDWLGEGIDQDKEGEYSERSPNYASEVTNRSLLIVARQSRKPALRENVRRNLELTLFRLQPNGELETVQSRRQDQTGVQDVWKYLTHYRELAIRTSNKQFASIAEQIIDRVAADPASFATAGYSVGEFLSEALAYPDLTATLPTGGSAPTSYVKQSKGSSLVRIRRGATSATIFGGTDYHDRREDQVGRVTAIREILSGLSTNPTFFKFRKGAAIPPQGLQGPHHQDHDQGDPAGGFTLDFDIDGPATSLTIELCFRSGGNLTGVVAASGDGNYQLVDGQGSYTVGGDTITFGPGTGTGSGAQQPIAMDPGRSTPTSEAAW